MHLQVRILVFLGKCKVLKGHFTLVLILYPYVRQDGIGSAPGAIDFFELQRVGAQQAHDDDYSAKRYLV